MDAIIILSVALFILFFGLALRHWYVYLIEKSKLVDYVDGVVFNNSVQIKKQETVLDKWLKWVLKYADDYSSIGQRINFFSENYEVEDWLRKAGHPLDLTVERFQGMKILSTYIGFFSGIIFFILGFPFSKYGLIFLPLGGYFSSIIYLKLKAKKRQEQIRYDLPDFLDTVSVTLQAGISLDQAFREVIKYFDGAIREEFARFNQEIDLGVPREKAYQELLKRNDNQEFQTLIKAIIQGLKLGVPMATTFKLQAENLRGIRKEQAKEKAAKASPKVTLITTFVITPIIMILMAGLMILNAISGDNSVIEFLK